MTLQEERQSLRISQSRLVAIMCVCISQGTVTGNTVSRIFQNIYTKKVVSVISIDTHTSKMGYTICGIILFGAS